MFHGVTDDPLSRACALLGDHERAGVLRARALDAYQRLGATWWAERLVGPAPPAGKWSRAAGDDAAARTRRRLVRRARGFESPVPARRGLEHLHALLADAGREVPATRLAGVLVEEADLGPSADRVALAAYRRRLAEIEAELDRADGWADVGRPTGLGGAEALLAEVAAATGLAGRPRPTGSSAERARVTVRKAIAAALRAVRDADPVVARHLTAHVRTGGSCAYEPDADRPVTWRL